MHICNFKTPHVPHAHPPSVSSDNGLFQLRSSQRCLKHAILSVPACAAPGITCHRPPRLIGRLLLLLRLFCTMPAAGISRTFATGSRAAL